MPDTKRELDLSELGSLLRACRDERGKSERPILSLSVIF